MNYKLVIMVSIYNSGEWLKNRLDNLMDTTTITDSQVWCLNANSPDPRDDDIPRQYPVKYLKLNNRITVYEAWNYIISTSKSKYITNANTDDIVAPTAYEELMHELDSDDQIGIACCPWYTTHKPNLSWCHVDGRKYHPSPYRGDITKTTLGHFPLWRRDIHDKVGLFDVQFKSLADADLWARIYHKTDYKFAIVDKPLGCYYYRDGENYWHKNISSQQWDAYFKKVEEYKNA